MLSVGAIRKIDSVNTAHLSDEELEGIRKSFYDFGQLMFDDWMEQKFSSKHLIGLLTEGKEKNTM